MHSGKVLLTVALASASVLLNGCVVAPTGSPYYGEVITVAPPQPRVEYRPPPPAIDYLWINGYWDWTGSSHRWVPCHWQAPRPGYAWEPHRWEHDGLQHGRQHGGQWRQLMNVSLGMTPVRNNGMTTGIGVTNAGTGVRPEGNPKRSARRQLAAINMEKPPIFRDGFSMSAICSVFSRSTDPAPAPPTRRREKPLQPGSSSIICF